MTTLATGFARPGGALLLTVILLAGSAGLPTLAMPDGAEPSYILRVQVRDRANDVPRLAEMQLDLAGIDTKANTVDFVGTWDDFLTLSAAGFDPWIVESFPPAGPGTDEAGGPLSALSDYLDPTEVTQRLDQYVAQYPALIQKIQIATTEQGRPEWAVKISDNVALEEDEPTIFFVGQHHAREVMTPEITLDIVDYLLTRYATDAKVKHWVDTNEIWVVVSHNPDGAQHVFSVYNMWRKNRRDNLDGNFGVDPNRNYPFKWNGCGGSSGSTGSDTYRGPSAASEPETQGFVQLARDHRPAINLSYHTYSELSIHPYGCTGVHGAENRVFRDMSSDQASRIPNDAGTGYYSNGTAWELLYAVDGEMNDWFYGELGSYGLTIEANSSTQGFQPDYATWRDSTVSRNRAGWQFLLDRLEGPGITGHVTDACTGAPVPATHSLSEVVFTNGETPRTAAPQFGRFTWLTVPGAYTLNASHPGYSPQSWTVEVGHGMARREVRLVPDGSFGAELLSFTVDDAAGDADGQIDPGETVTLPISVRATGGALTALTGTLSSPDPFVTVTRPSVSFGAVGAGGTATSAPPHAELRLSQQAPDGHVIPLRLTFQADQTLCAPVSEFETRATTGSPACPAVAENLDVNPGWTIQNTDALGWAFGPPGGGGNPVGPASARSGVNVYGTNLVGNYGNNATYVLKTTAFDVSGFRNLELRYWRWLNNEDGYDIASIEISTDNVQWTEIWKGWGRDTSWQLYRHDIASLTADAGTVYVRFRLQTDGSETQSGWYLDDVWLCGESREPAPRFVVTSWSLLDSAKPSCSDGDSWADGGEVADLTVNLRNDGNRTADGAEVFLSSSNADVGLTTVRASLGSVPPGGTASGVFRFKVADGVSCREAAAIDVAYVSDDGRFSGAAGTINLTLEANAGTPVPDTTDNFESNAGWTLGTEWQIASPAAKGGSSVPNGAGGKDPATAFNGTKVLGLDLTGLGLSQGNYENSVTGTMTAATSPVYDNTNATGVSVSFKRWLCAESSTADRATFDVFDGTLWRPVWSNPTSDLSDASWQSVSYDVSQWADGRPDFRVRFTVTPNFSRAFCGWNVDNLVVHNGYTPTVCDTQSCAAGCTPSTEASGLRIARGPSGDLVTWTPSADACRETTGGPTYRVYRSGDPAPRVEPVAVWPDDTFFTDVSGRDADGSATNASFTERDEPLPGEAYYYLVVVMGSNGLEGPVGHYGK